jgi:hypothetical protein
MDHELSAAGGGVVQHLASRFPSREIALLGPADGPIHENVPNLHIIRLSPAADEEGWLYVTAGLWDAIQREGHGLEFILLAPQASDVHTETLTMVAFYHATGGEYELDLGHTMPIGRPWLPGATCDHLLVSLPYPWGPDLEECPLSGGHARILWLLPITKAERDFKVANGLEALEQRLEAEAIIPADPQRASVIRA